MAHSCYVAQYLKRVPHPSLGRIFWGARTNTRAIAGYAVNNIGLPLVTTIVCS